MEDEQELVCFVSNGAISRWNYMPTVPDCVSHMLIKRQRTVQNHTQDCHHTVVGALYKIYI